MDVPVRAAFWRGGTSRAVLFREQDVQAFDEREREAIILAAMGSPDPNGRQVDGLGGGISSLSKAAIIGRASADSGADVTFRFAQVDVEKPKADFAGNCGNISAAVGPFALDTGLVQLPADAGVARIVVLSVNTGQLYVAHVPVRDGRFDPEGDFAIDGVPGRGSRIGLEYLEPGGSAGRGLLPTGAVRECVRLSNGRDVAVSILDAANPMVYVRAADLDATATESPVQIDADRLLCQALEELRAEAAVRIGLAANRQEATERCTSIPKVAFVAPPRSYQATDGQTVSGAATDVTVRMISVGKAHRTLAMTAGICTAVASAVDGTVVAEIARAGSAGPRVVRLGHAAGILPVGVNVCRSADGGWRAASATTYRTARKIMDGQVYVPASSLEGRAWFQTAATRDEAVS